jgi:acetyl-CoA C-acetyltransferase
MTSEYARRAPVIVGVGQYTRRSTDPAGAAAPDPVGLMAMAAHAALGDAGMRGKEGLIDAVDIVNVLSWRFDPDAAHALSGRLGIGPDHLAESPVGGEQPVALVDQMAHRIASGEVRFGLIAGAEAQASLNAYRRAGDQPPWPLKPQRRPTVSSTLQDILHPEAWRHDLRTPVQVYPLFENALRAQRGQSYAEAQAESALIWSNMSRIAVGNRFAWHPEFRSPDEIATPSPQNRWIYYPYPKMMNAWPAVDQAAAILMTSREVALELGVPVDRLVAPVAAAGAREIRDPLSRGEFHRSMAMEAALDAALCRAAVSPQDLDALELYSCFPCVPKMAIAHLGLRSDTTVTVAGGLSFFGGPGNNYMLHAIAAMVEQLRRSQGRAGLLYGQGEFVTKHHALVLRSGATRDPYQPGTETLAAQRDIDIAGGPPFEHAPHGNGEIETFTANWNRDGSPGVGTVVARLNASGRRFIGRTAEGDAESFQLLTGGSVEPVGLPVHVEARADGNVVTVSSPGAAAKPLRSDAGAERGPTSLFSP